MNPPFFFASSYRRLFVELRSRLLTLGRVQARLALLSLNRNLPTTFRKFARLDLTSFCLKILPPCGCGDFQANPLRACARPQVALHSKELGYSNLLFNFVVGTIKHQATGRQKAVVRGTDSYMLATPFSLFAEANQARGMSEAIRYSEQVDWF